MPQHAPFLGALLLLFQCVTLLFLRWFGHRMDISLRIEPLMIAWGATSMIEIITFLYAMNQPVDQTTTRQVV
jgi:hypothetical protein